MKTPKHTLILILLALLLAALACRFGSGNTPAAPAADPTEAKPSQGELTTAVAGEKAPAAEGQFVLGSPEIGLDGLASYRQTLTSTVNGSLRGQPYTYSQTVLRVAKGLGETNTVQATTNGEAMYLFTARLGETLYTSQNENQPCRAASAENRSAGENPARRLPPVYGAVLQQNETLGNVPVVYYTFDEKAVPHLAGKNGRASGKLWVAEQGGAVLKYELTVEVQERDFTGEQTWSYALESGSSDSDTLELPAGCQTLLLDFPIMPEAKYLIQQPGFMRYTVQSSHAEARQFFLNSVPGAGWEPIPSTSANPELNVSDPDLPMLTFVKPNPDGSGRVAVVQLTGSDGGLTVIVQTAKTKAAVTFYDMAGDIPTPEAEEEPTPEPEDGSPSSSKLPEDLPVYKGASMVTQTQEMMMFTTPDAQQKVADFYSSAMEQAGWEKNQEYSAGGTAMQMWKKDSLELMIAISDASGSTMVVITIN